MSGDQSAYRLVNRSPLSLMIARQLRSAIVGGELAVGEELPPEKELAERFGVSRPTVREALRILQAQGLLTGGDTVSTARPQVSVKQTASTASDALIAAVKLGQLSLRELIELRAVLEAAAVAMPIVDRSALDEARAALAVMRDPAVGVSEFHEADNRFHAALAHLGGNAAVALVAAVIREATADQALAALEHNAHPAPELNRLANEHAAILDLIERDRPELAAEHMRYHVPEHFDAPAGQPD